MSKNLLIVESPAKAKTIEKYLGKDFTVKSSFGHIRDLPKKGALDVDCLPGKKDAKPTGPCVMNYIVPDEKKKVVAELKKAAKEAETVWLATDEDREGEAISWHLCEVLKLDHKKTPRIVFHEITEKAIRNAVDQPRHINIEVVDAQQARRALDRLVGFELSGLLWRKVPGEKLSAGRVQSVAVRLIVEREEAIDAFDAESSFKISAEFHITDKSGDKTVLNAELPQRFKEESDAEGFLKDCINTSFQIGDIQVKPAKKSPTAPFTTSTLQQDASRKLSFSVVRTMAVAQRLYESGMITYMRTDSVNLSESAINAAAAYISGQYGENYVKTRRFKTKSSGAQEAHEAIRPTDMSRSEIDDSEVSLREEDKKLYRLIWLRTLASQMADAEFERTTVSIDIESRKEKMQAKGEVLKFDGFLKVYRESVEEEAGEDNLKILPPLSVGQTLELLNMTAVERFTRHPARFTEASLVRKLEELGIGRPSTYAPTINTVQKRGYVVKEDREGTERKFRQLEIEKDGVKKSVQTETTGREKSKLFPTDKGRLVNGFLVEYFQKVMDYQFTASIEQEFDEIAQGQNTWPQVVGQFYWPFHQQVEVVSKEAGRVTGERHLGTDPKSGKPVYARMGKFGPMAMIGTVEDEDKPKFAKLVGGLQISSVTLEEALKLFALPKTIGEYRDEEVVVSQGRFGPYVRNKGKFYSIPKGEDPLTLKLDRAIELIDAKEEADAKKFIKEFEEEGIQLLNGRWGPYIKKGKRNFKIPKGMEPADLTLEDCQLIIEKAPEKKRKSKASK